MTKISKQKLINILRTKRDFKRGTHLTFNAIRLLKSTVMQIEQALINDRLPV